MAAIKIQVEKRTELGGKNKVDKIRDNDIVPGVLYGKGEETKHVQVDRRMFEKVYRSAGMSTLIDLELDGEVLPVLIKEVQKHPFKNEYLHVDFQQLNMDETVKLTLPITLVGRENIQHQPSVLIQQLDEIEIECLPKDIPEDIVVDVSNIDFTTPPIFVSDLEIFGNEDVVIFREADDVIASLIEPTEEEIEEEEEEVLEADEVPVIGEEDEEEVEEVEEPEE